MASTGAKGRYETPAWTSIWHTGPFIMGWNGHGHGHGLESLPNPGEERQNTSTKLKWCC